MPLLSNVSITFNTHGDNKDSDTILHVFVKNRVPTSLGSQGPTDFVGNLLAFQNGPEDPDDFNPYLATGISLGQGVGFDDPSSNTFNLTLRTLPTDPLPITADEIVLPTVDIHILPNGNDTWEFDFKIVFEFDNDSSKCFAYSSNNNGVTGIVLDQDNPNYTGICTENPLNTQFPQMVKAVTNAALTSVLLEFVTHGDISDNSDNKDFDTVLNVHITNRVSASVNPDIAIGLNLFPNVQIPAGTYASYTWSAAAGHPLASTTIMLRDMVLPIVNLIIVPNGNDTWIFDYKITFEFDNGQKFSSQTNGVILNQNCTKYAGVYNGDSFPSMTPPTQPPLTAVPTNLNQPVLANDRSKAVAGTSPLIPGTPVVFTKTISLSFLQQKLDEFINNRQGLPGQDPPLMKLRFHNSGVYGSNTLPESYLDVQSLEANGVGGTDYDHSPMSLGQLTGKNIIGNFNVGSLYFNDINSQTITLKLDPTQNPPLTLTIDFETNNDDGQPETIGAGPGVAGTVTGGIIGGILGGPIGGVIGGAIGGDVGGTPLGTMDFTQFSITIKLTLDCVGQKIDLMSWAQNPATYSNFINVSVTTTKKTDPGGDFESEFTDKIYQKLTQVDMFTNKSLLDNINSQVNSWLLGGVVDGDIKANNNIVQSAQISGGNLIITYTGPQTAFQYQTPANWPTATNPTPANAPDFSPGNLANIDHIVVLSMENRSFDHMLGYLSLPVSQGGMGRSDVDGLTGGEYNPFQGKNCPTFAFAPNDTIFSPDPPHSYEPVNKAIDGGKMDDFVKSYAEKNGPGDASRIMGHQSTATVPSYDALARDFAFCHRWFAAHPGPTFCNRFYELTGRLNIDPEGFWEFSNSDHIRPVFTKTIFDYLSASTDPATGKPVTWKYFEDGYCFLRFFQNYTFDTQNIANVNDSEFGFFALAAGGNLPSVSYIDPHFIELPPHGNCDGPPADVKAGQALVRKVVEAVVASPNWNKTLLVITYDEHGGFYDHVPPPAAVKVSADSPIGTYGVRIPTFVISPWVGAGMLFGKVGQTLPEPIIPLGGGTLAPSAPSAPATPAPAPVAGKTPTVAAAAAVRPAGLVSSGAGLIAPIPAVIMPAPATPTGPTPYTSETGIHVGGQFFDHTSVLKTIARRFMSKNPPYMGARYAAAQDLSSVIGTTMRQTQFLPFLGYTLTYAASQKVLTMQTATNLPGGTVSQTDSTSAQPDPVNNLNPQKFTFEDAGGGFFYIRTHTGNLYLTVVIPLMVMQPVGAAAAPAAGATQSYALKQDVKYTPGTGMTIAQSLALGANPDCQKWKMVPASATTINNNSFTIVNAHLPTLVLQPAANSLQSGAAVVLAAPTAGATVLARPNAWQITSPLLPNSALGVLSNSTGVRQT